MSGEKVPGCYRTACQGLDMLKKDIDSINETAVKIDKYLLEFTEEISKVKQDDS
ncbi:hypothetical protein DJ95_1460 [Bacillus atrophaeus subsp. globigii]|uniref:DUF1657 domain-containing protein n=1 Tax=Bacillus atrophaeus (strain 1942) TaxID=720555 RepID=A0ABN3ZCR6_BACA1|nr:hypothetical protein BATR1942_07815 [Bacillus atrophaeus 1942]AIK47850.1 hypothetical protein DJ95_1460 [Bacillus atrophaeus subsp. globigii]EIM11700.1 hypothetical protein UY9_05547 [Bacillus atrophaeus C89]KFK84438.1 hypothetical protein DK44_2175 [Bacillus atrophaeus]